MGALLTYAIIESMNPDNMIAEDVTNHNIINYMLKRWLDDAVSTLLPFLQPLFKEYISEFLHCLVNKAINNRSPEDPDGLTVFVKYLVDSSNILDKECITELHSAFFDIYPTLQFPLKEFKKDIPNLLQKIKEDEEKYLAKEEQQKKCIHNFVKTHIQFKDKMVTKCNKCNKFKYPY